ncbi:DUF1772 domain-containing protein [Catellatospora sp. KI3]|uniref:anthrone oxygenase family protein n=1 Tax=Catellatospora sp. KI3 TaxID=3041620 RepID=UPI002482E60F|nr:DUF1772 domain-containing protein [Catellatospora sp. KI3]MDI1461375.1 DUF1772 domain-containing protein [Catellatospora sp. KI3]
MSGLGSVVLVAATVATGMMAGVFGLYAHTVMPGLRRTDDRTFVGAFQAIDRAIINGWFLGAGFLGAPVLTGAAALLHLGAPDRAALRWIVAAFALYLVTFFITAAVHVPLNNELKAAGEPDDIADLAAVRARFAEARWARWNTVRAIATTAAAFCLAAALTS